MPSINILAKTNGVGIDRDVALMQQALRPFAEAGFHSARRWDMLAERIRQVLGARHAAELSILTERVPPFYAPAGKTALIPNQERFPRRHLGRLGKVDLVLAKTRHAETIFRNHAQRLAYVGFTSVDRQQATSAPDYDRFFHLAGRSTLKGTEILMEVWGQHPEWPTLTVVQHPSLRPDMIPPNVDLHSEYLDDATLQRMQNEHGVHLCPSKSEGWGHYIAEAMSCRAVVVTTNGPPMNELVTNDRGVLVAHHHHEPRHLGVNWHVDPKSLEETIERLLNTSTESKRELGGAARHWFETNDLTFKRRFVDVIEQFLRKSTKHDRRHAA